MSDFFFLDHDNTIYELPVEDENTTWDFPPPVAERPMSPGAAAGVRARQHKARVRRARQQRAQQLSSRRAPALSALLRCAMAGDGARLVRCDHVQVQLLITDFGRCAHGTRAAGIMDQDQVAKRTQLVLQFWFGAQVPPLAQLRARPPVPFLLTVEAGAPGFDKVHDVLDVLLARLAQADAAA